MNQTQRNFMLKTARSIIEQKKNKVRSERKDRMVTSIDELYDTVREGRFKVKADPKAILMQLAGARGSRRYHDVREVFEALLDMEGYVSGEDSTKEFHEQQRLHRVAIERLESALFETEMEIMIGDDEKARKLIEGLKDL